MPLKQGQLTKYVCKVCGAPRDTKPGAYCTPCRKEYFKLYQSFKKQGLIKNANKERPKKRFHIIFGEEEECVTL